MIYICWQCRHENDIAELDGEDHFTCEECEETNYIMGGRTMNYDNYYEGCCESQEAQRTEESMYGESDTGADSDVSDTPRTFRDDKWDD